MGRHTTHTRALTFALAFLQFVHAFEETVVGAFRFLPLPTEIDESAGWLVCDEASSWGGLDDRGRIA